MECYVLQDLLPLYAEQLTAPETSADVQAHLDACEKCAQIYARMKSPAPEVAAPEDIKPLKKVKQRSRVKIIVLSLCSSVVLTLFVLFGAYGIIPLRSDQLQMALRVYWQSYDENGALRRYDTPEEAGEHAEERINITFKGDCIEWRTALSCFNWRHHRGEPDESILTNTLLTFYPTVVPRTFHSQYWAVLNDSMPVIDGYLITIHCRDADYVFEVTELARRARNGETVITLGG